MEETEAYILIRDLGPWDEFLTVTNAAEWVVLDVVARHRVSTSMKIYYIDSEGMIDELVHDGGKFVRFMPGGPEMGPSDATSGAN